jgi:hypothetical protein
MQDWWSLLGYTDVYSNWRYKTWYHGFLDFDAVHIHYPENGKSTFVRNVGTYEVGQIIFENNF